MSFVLSPLFLRAGCCGVSELHRDQLSLKQPSSTLVFSCCGCFFERDIFLCFSSEALAAPDDVSSDENVLNVSFMFVLMCLFAVVFLPL